MTTFIIGLLTAVLVLNCVILILLVLIQLPKKEAGAGVAFGGGATDALFGSGSGNALTKMTRYGVIAFFALTLIVSILQTNRSDTAAGLRIDAELQSAPQPQPTVPTGTPPTAPSTIPLDNTVVSPDASEPAATEPAAETNQP